MSTSHAIGSRTATTASSSRSVVLLASGLSVCLAGLPLAHANDAAFEALTVEQFVARIGADLPEFELIQSDVLAAEAGLADVRALPALALSYEREEVFASGDGLALKNAISLGWSLDVSGRRGQREKSAELSVKAARRNAQHKKHLVLIGALELYYGAARARLRVASLHRTREPIAKLVGRLKNRVGAGDASGGDLARFELELSEHDDRLAEAEAAHAIARTKLAALLGAPDRNIEAIDSLEPPSLPRASASAAETAFANRSDVQAAALEGESGKALTRAAGRWWVPTLDVSAGYLNTDLGPGTGTGPDVAHGYQGGLSMSIPLFSRGRAERKRGEARIRRAEAKWHLLRRQISVEVKNAQTLLKSRVKRTRSFQERQLVRAAVLVRSMEAAYQGGEASSLELRDAYRAVATAELRHIELRYQCRLAELDLWRATGKHGQGEQR